MEENLRYIESYGFNETVLNPVALFFTSVMAILVFVLPRKYRLIPYLATACFITHIQRIVVSGFDFDMIRILVFFGLVKVFWKKEYMGIGLLAVDRWILAFAALTTVMHTIQLGTMEAFINRAGFSFDVLGMYFIARCSILEFEDLNPIIKAMQYFIIPIAMAMAVEQMTGRNLFSVFGGVSEFTMIRDGRLRSQGAFSHPILAGTFGAITLPIFVGYLLVHKKGKLLSFFSTMSSVIIVGASNSSGPIISMVLGIIGLFVWKLRRFILHIMWSFFILIIILHLIMKDPVWALIYRFGVISASTGYHRYALINQAINHFGEWWLFGTRKMGTWGWGLQDVTNQYIRIGVDGGVFTLLCFLIVILLCFFNIWRIVFSVQYSYDDKFFAWCLGASLLVHVVSFMSVAYFGQMIPIWYMTISIIASLPSVLKVRNQSV